jgi:hypothetical protein
MNARDALMIEESRTAFLAMSSVKTDEVIAWDSSVIVLVVQLAENATGADFIWNPAACYWVSACAWNSLRR